MKNKKQAITLSIIAIITLITLIVGATYAYFQVAGDKSKSTDVNVTTYTSDLLTFEIGNDIAIYADQTSFGSGKGNATGSTFAKAILTANNKTNTATEHYYLYLNISNNTFLYTQNENTTELLLTITDASGNAVTDITNLTYKTVTDGKGASISGYDITNKSGLITLFDNKAITASPAKTDQWNITVTLVNYNEDQSNNMGKEFSAMLMIQKEEIVLAYHNSCNDNTLACHVAKLYTETQGENSIYYHDSDLANGTGDNSYRYAGPSDSVNNFVCFGSDAETCPIDNLYRIIGVIDDKVKLIKYDYATSTLLGTSGDYKKSVTPSSTYKGSLSKIYEYYWNYKNESTWSTSLLNKTNLNTKFINNIGSTWVNKIAITTWKVGATFGYIDGIQNSIPPTAYEYEVGAKAGKTIYEAKIGLVYVSDYYYAASPSAWTLVGYNSSDSTKDYRAATSINWMFMGHDEWTISRTETLHNVFFLNKTGYVSADCQANYSKGVRPVFNLVPKVTYVSGSGTQSDPMRIN